MNCLACCYDGYHYCLKVSNVLGYVLGCFWQFFFMIIYLLFLVYLQLWNSISEGSLGVYRGHSGWVHCVTFSKDASKLVSASDDETVKVIIK